MTASVDEQRTSRLASWGWFVLRWGIAIVGIAWVVSNLTIRDHVLVLMPDGTAERAAAVEPRFLDPRPVGEIVVEIGGEAVTVDGGRLINPPDRETVTVDGVDVALLGMRLSGDINADPTVEALLVEGRGWVEPVGFELSVPQPLVEVGVRHLVADADPWLLAAGLGVFPLTFGLSAWRWQRLIRAVGLDLPYRRVFALTMVGQFYSAFLPGSTGGDVVKAVYATRQTSDRELKEAAAVSVLVDRVIGLIALVMLGGVTSALAWYQASEGTPTAVTCRAVLAGCSVVLIGTLGATLFLAARDGGWSDWRRLKALRERLPGGALAGRTLDTLTLYARRPGLILWGVLVTLPVHLTVATSGMLGGMAFGLPVSWGYYYVVVPVVTLAASVPISPQGAGVMEFFAVTLLNRQGVTVGQAFALTLFIRLAHVMWYLVGGVFVLRGVGREEVGGEARRHEGTEAQSA